MLAVVASNRDNPQNVELSNAFVIPMVITNPAEGSRPPEEECHPLLVTECQRNNHGLRDLHDTNGATNLAKAWKECVRAS